MNKKDNLNIKILSSLSYIGPLFIVGKFSVEKDSKEYKFHSKQGKYLFFSMTLILLFFIILEYFLSAFSESLSVIFLLVYIAISISWIIMSIIGISGAIKNKKVKLPFIEILLKKNKKAGD